MKSASKKLLKLAKQYSVLSLIVFTSFSINAQTLTVTSPVGGDILIGAQTYTLTWTTTGSIPVVDLYYLNNGVQYTIELNVANTGTYNWTVPNNISPTGNGHIRVKDEASPYYDQNDSPFSFEAAPKTFTLTYPNALTDTIQAGESNTITWDWTGTMSKVHLYYSLNGGTSYTRFSNYYGEANDGSFDWTPNSSISSTELRIKIDGYHPNNAVYIDESDTTTVLKIGKTINLSSPLNTNFISGTTRTLDWVTTGGIDAIDIEYTTDFGENWTVIADSTANDGTHDWLIPTANANTVYLRIRAHGNYSVMKTYYSYSITTTAQTVTLTSPNGGNTYTEGDPIVISWTNSANTASNIFTAQFSLDSGATWTQVDDNLAANGSLNWAAPFHANSTKCLVSIFSQSPYIQDVSDTSDMTFSINLGVESVKINAPNGGENYIAGRYTNVSYTTTGSTDSLNLYYSEDNGSIWTLLKTGIDPLLSYTNITYPDIHSTSVLLRMEDKSNPSINDVSDSVFTISRIKSNRPYASENLYIGNAFDIRWQNSPLVSATLSLYYSTDDGSTWDLIDNNVPNAIDYPSYNTYSWTVPNDTSSTCKIKIEDNIDNTVFEVSANFKILTSPLEVTSPNGGEYWDATTYYPITWNTTGSITKVKIFYSNNGGTSWNQITSNYTNTGSFTWYTPNITSSEVKVKVQNRYDANQFDISDAVFNVGITPPDTINITSPNGGEVLTSGGNHNITWTNTGTVDFVDIYYSADAGANWTSIIANEPNVNSYNWTVPAINQGGIIIKVEENGDPTSFDISDATFSIGKSITVTSPNGGEALEANTMQTITWTHSGSITYVNIQYSIDGGANFIAITSTLANTNTYNWSVPNNVSSNCIIRVEQNFYTSYFDLSDNAFSITPSTQVELITPNGGETLAETSTYDITWDTDGISSTVDLFYSLDSAATWQSLASNLTNTGLYNWQVPASTASTQAYIKMEATKNGQFSTDSSDLDFSIITAIGTLTLLTPNGGETWMHDAGFSIDWQSTGSISKVDLYYSLDAGASWNGIVTNSNNDGTHFWNIPYAVALSDSCLIKIEANGLTYINDISDGLFSIIEEPNSINVTAPAYPVKFWEEGDTEAINWNTDGLIPMVDIYVSTDGGVNYTLIEDSIANNMGSGTAYNWLIPHGLNSYNGKIKVVETGNPAVFAQSYKVNISDLRSVTMLTPNGGEIFNGHDTIDFTWVEAGLIGNIEFNYSMDNGVSWDLAGSVDIYDTATVVKFVLPNENTTSALVKITGNYLGFTDQSDATFTVNDIPKSITVNSPNGGSWGFWGSSAIDFHSSGVARVNMLYSIDSTQTWHPILNNKAIDYQYFNWQGPNINSSKSFIKVEDASDNTVFDISDAPIDIYGYSTLSMSVPNGSNKLRPDSTYTLSWDYTAGSINKLSRWVKLTYSTDGGATWLTIQNNVANTNDPLASTSELSGTFTYNWTVPLGIESNNCMVRVHDLYNDNDPYYVQSISNNFSIGAAKSLDITSPINGTLFQSDSTHNITWINTGTINNVNLYYSLDDGATWVSIVNTYANTGLYAWTAPSATHSNALIKIEDASDNTITAISQQFVITIDTLSLTITSPNGGEVLTVGDTYPVTWDWTGKFTTQWVLYYSVDSAATWNFITDGQAVTLHQNENHTVNWTVPLQAANTTYDKCFIRVISSASDTSNAVFRIQYPTYTWDGTAWSNGISPTATDNILIAGDYDTSTDGDISAYNIMLSPGVNVTIGAGNFIEVNGDLTHNGTSFTVQSGGSLVTLGSVSGSDFIFDRSTTFDQNTGRYSIVGAPVSNANFSVLGANALIYGYDETEPYNEGVNDGLDRFKTPVQLGHSTMQVGVGYFSAFTGDVNGKVTFLGTPNTGTQSVLLSITNPSNTRDKYNGFNLISNPYPCAIDAISFITANSTDMKGAIYLWDDFDSDVVRGTNADYVVVNGLGIITQDSRNVGGTKWDGIHSMQGFFVRAENFGDLNLEFTDAMKVTGNNTDAGFYRTISEQVSFKLSLSNEQGAYSETLIGMREDATLGVDIFDASLFNFSGTKIYSQISGEAYAIQGVPDFNQSEIPLGINIVEASNFTINLDELKNIEGYSIVLKDHLLNKSIELSAGKSYTFSAVLGQTNDRFSVSVKNTITGIEEVNTQNWIVFQNEIGGIILRSNYSEIIKSVELISLSGKRKDLQVNQLNTNEWATIRPKIKGLYIVRIITETTEQTQKIILR